LIISAFASSAQRYADWEVVDIVEPKILRSTTVGTEFSIIAALRNNGPDMMLPGDSLYYQIAILNTSNEVLVQIPRGWYFTFIYDTIPPGDTLFFDAGTHRMNTYPRESSKLKVMFTSLIFGYGTVNWIYDDTLTTNNSLIVERNWLNPEGSLSISSADGHSSVDLTPNPANEVVDVNWLINSSLSNTALIQVVDMTGRTVLSREVDSRVSSLPIDIAELEQGIYTVHVVTGQLHFTERLVVHH